LHVNKFFAGKPANERIISLKSIADKPNLHTLAVARYSEKGYRVNSIACSIIDSMPSDQEILCPECGSNHFSKSGRTGQFIHDAGLGVGD
jgi:hypothetical protein